VLTVLVTQGTEGTDRTYWIGEKLLKSVCATIIEVRDDGTAECRWSREGNMFDRIEWDATCWLTLGPEGLKLTP
jgi:hypothetical protein